MISGNDKLSALGAEPTRLAHASKLIRTQKLGAFFFAVLCAILLIACGAARPIKYYQLTVPGDAAAPSASDQSPITLLVGNLQASHLYREDHIIYSSGGTQMGAYESQRWAEPPTEMVEEVLIRELRASGRFHAVYIHRSNTTGDFLLRGHLYDFKEVSESSVIARCTFELELQELKSGKIVWTHYYTHDEPAASKDVSAVVSALDKNVQLGIRGALTSLGQFFISHPTK
jgi:cholesterol transport system auxiliary component